MRPDLRRAGAFLTDEEIRAKNERLAPHREKAVRAFGEERFNELFRLSSVVWVDEIARHWASVTEREEQAALSVADLLEKARSISRDMAREADRDVWRRLGTSLADALRLVEDHAKVASRERGVYDARKKYLARREGRPSLRAAFVQAALAGPNMRAASAGAWAHLGLAVHVEDEDEDFETLRKSYADLLHPGKTSRRKVSRARETRRDR